VIPENIRTTKLRLWAVANIFYGLIYTYYLRGHKEKWGCKLALFTSCIVSLERALPPAKILTRKSDIEIKEKAFEEQTKI
jgi:hypothetical protein